MTEIRSPLYFDSGPVLAVLGDRRMSTAELAVECGKSTGWVVDRLITAEVEGLAVREPDNQNARRVTWRQVGRGVVANGA